MIVHGPTSRVNSADGPKRPPIMAMESGPGPAAYKLPGSTGHMLHDPSLKRWPAYTFGSRTRNGFSKYQSSPGPVYAIHPSITRKGKAGPPAYSLHDRTGITRISQNPGPAAYHIGLCKNTHINAPKYSFGLKGDKLYKNLTPAPNCYTLPHLLGQNVVSKCSNPAYTMGGRQRIGGLHWNLSKGPGPGTYKTVDLDIFTNKSPVYSMHIRPPGLSSMLNTPGPGAHNAEQVTVRHRRMPQYSFGIKHSIYKAPMFERVDD